jgi:hypothetical protein
VLAGLAAQTSALSANEEAAYVYSLALDLSAFDLGFEVGTDHPRVTWSGRVPESVHDRSLPGPDGFEDLAPLARTGMLNPALQDRLVGVFVGGFKRVHGAFAWGELANRNGGSHYGFVEQGVELSRLWPGLATVVVETDGTVDLRTWSSDRTPRHARQNGLPVLERGPDGILHAGPFVRSWALGNWSGSAEGDLRTVRGGLALQRSDSGRFLVYSYFANATPSAMADVYAAYDCDYAMLLDMNALEHTYLALDLPEGGQLRVRHLVLGMEVLDKTRGDEVWQRFVGFPDNRDFFYVLRRR